jgi:hypothetical protein
LKLYRKASDHKIYSIVEIGDEYKAFELFDQTQRSVTAATRKDGTVVFQGYEEIYSAPNPK